MDATSVVLGQLMASPSHFDLNPSALIASQQRRSAFVPKVDGHLVVQMPGESMRCLVKRVMDDDTVFVLIEFAPVARGQHMFAFNEVYGARRRTRDAREYWQLQTEREFMNEQQRLYEAANPPPVAAPKSAPKVAARKAAKPEAAAKPEYEKPKPKKTGKAKPKNASVKSLRNATPADRKRKTG